MTFNRLTIRTDRFGGVICLKRLFIHQKSFRHFVQQMQDQRISEREQSIPLVRKIEGQSTTEYLLVTLLASVFVFALAVRMSPELQTTLNRLEDVVALKLSGGKLLGHVKETETLRFEGPTSGTGAAATPTEAAGAAGAPGASGTGIAPSGGEDLSFPGGSKPQGRRAGQAGGGREAGEFSQESEMIVPPQGAAQIKVRPPTSEAQQATKEAKKKEDFDAKTKGRIYQEGEEGEIFGAKGFNWLRILIILLIIILVAYIGFEIFKGVKSTRVGR